MHTDQGRYDKPLAWLLALGLQGLLLALLWRMPQPSGSSALPAHDPSRIRLSWLPRPPPAAAVPQPQPILSNEIPRPANAAPTVTGAQPRPLPPAPPPAAESAPSDYSMRADEWARRPPDPSRFAPDPLGNRQVRLPGGQAPERFQMKPPRSVKGVLDGIGELFGGVGYAQGPCPEIRRQAEVWKTDTSERGRARLAHELERERRHCRP